jgi:hypothetical protein
MQVAIRQQHRAPSIRFSATSLQRWRDSALSYLKGT